MRSWQKIQKSNTNQRYPKATVFSDYREFVLPFSSGSVLKWIISHLNLNHADEMAQLIEVLAGKPDNLSSIPKPT